MKNTTQTIKQEFKKRGWQLLSTYENVKTKLTYICDQGHKHTIRLDHFRNGVGCPYCSDKFKKSISFIKPIIEREGYTLLSKKYINAHTPLELICEHGSPYKISWANWRRGTRCLCKESMIGKRFGRLVVVEEPYKGSCMCRCDCGNYSIRSLYNIQKGKVKSCGCLRKETYKYSRKDLTGQVFGNLIALKDVGIVITKGRLWYCYCSCGSYVEVPSSKLLSGKIKSCGCLTTKDLIGKKFNKLEVIRKVGSNKCGNSMYLCKCVCGNETIVASPKITSGYTRSCGCLREELVGPNHPNWKGGKSFEPYCPIWKDREYKESIKQRDNNICQNPYCYKTTKRLSIHHIDYDKKNCAPNNLVTLCIGCNGRANKDREWHKEWYQTLMSKKYNY